MAAPTELPNLFVIGAPKCGTTSLHRYLGLHPEIEMSRVKEPALFAAPDYPGSLERYRGMFEGEAPVRGESSAVYSQWPGWPDVPERIAAAVPEARFIYLVRDPIERALGHYRQHVADHKEGRDVGTALADPSRPDHTYLAPSRYATQLERYFECFGEAACLVLEQRALLEERGPTLARAFAFLEVDAAFTSPAFETRHNTRAELRRPTAVGRGLERTGLRGAARRALPGGLRASLRGVTSRRIPEPVLDEGTRAGLIEELRPEAERLRRLTGLRLEGWSV